MHGHNNVLAVYKRRIPILGLHIDMSTSQKTGHLNGFSTASGLKGMLEGRDCSSVNAVSSFLVNVLDRAMRCSTNPALTPIHTIYFDSVSLIV